MVDYFIPYCAGFLDGEGCIQISRKTDKHTSAHGGMFYHLTVTLYNTNKDVLDLIQRNFGGSIYCDDRSDKTHKHSVYSLNISNNQGYEFLKLVQPYCIVKRKHIQNAILFQEYVIQGKHSSRNPLSPNDLIFYEQRLRLGQALNKRLL